jgi:predicted peptidase
MSLLGTAILVGLSAQGAAGQATRAAEPSIGPANSAMPSAAAVSFALTARSFDSVEGAPLGYLEYLPAGYGDGEPRPLLVYVHSAGSPGDGTEETLGLVANEGIPMLIQAGDWPADRPFGVLAPQYSEAAANSDCAMAEDLDRFLDFATQQYQVDPQRVYLTGISCGAIGIWDYLGAHGDEVVAASVPIAGHAEWALEESGCDVLARAPVWAFHGDRDEIVPTVHIQRPIDRIRACEGADAVEMELTVYPDADHDAWSRTYDLSAGLDPYAWLLEHERG